MRRTSFASRRCAVAASTPCAPGASRASRVLDVRELDADRAAVGLREVRRRSAGASPARGARRCPRWGRRVSRSAAESPKFASSSSGRPSRRVAERVEVREEVAAHAVGVDQLEDAPLHACGLEHRLGRAAAPSAAARVRRSSWRRARYRRGARPFPFPFAAVAPVPFVLAGDRAVAGVRGARRAAASKNSAPLRVSTDCGALVMPEGVKLLDVARVDAEFVEHGSLLTR